MEAIGTPERNPITFAKASPARSPAHADPQQAMTVYRVREALRSIAQRAVCQSCKSPSVDLVCDGDLLHCRECAADDAIAIPAVLADCLLELRTLNADLNDAGSRPRVRAKRTTATPDRTEGFQPLNPNTHTTPSKSSTSSAVGSDGLRHPGLDALAVSESRARDELLSTEAQERVSLQKTHAVALKQAKSSSMESSRQQKLLGDTKYEEAAYDAAVRHYTTAIRVNDSTASLSALFGNRSAAFFMLHQWDNCIEDCEASLQQDDVKHPNTRTKICQRASKASMCKGDLRTAFGFLNRIPENSRSAEIESDRLRYERGADQLDDLQNLSGRERIDALRLVVADFGDASPLRLQLAELYLDSGEYTRACQVVDMISHADAQVTLCRARALYMQGFERLPEAMKILEAAAQVDDDPRIAEEMRRVSAMEQGKQLGNTHFANGRFAESIEQYTSALGEAEGVANIQKILFCNRAASFKELKRYREGVEDCTKATTIDQKFGKAYTRRARCLLALECFDGASRDFNAALRLTTSADESRSLESELRNVDRNRRAAEEREKDLYAVLELRQEATEKEIKKQYKILSLKWHPDKNMGLSDDERQLAEHKFKKLSEAYATLSDDSKRRQYDLQRQRDRRPDAGGADFRYYDANTRARYNPPPPAWQRQPGKFW